ncbi:MAG: DUF4422 domain-containing protein [Candidatus Saccharibacteria bacterium]|nr:DUF4422 domain-containing protein [Candidatus Saccharibacteria bacterium]
MTSNHSTTKSATLIIASHKPYPTPNNNLYLPLQVGATGKDSIPSFQRDDSDENISTKNPNFCELTGLYWAWKNLDSDYIGLVHYRRYFAKRRFSLKFKPLDTPAEIDKKLNKNLSRALTNSQLEKLLKTSNVILPKKRNYRIETLYSHYAHTMHIMPLDETRKIIAQQYPKYLPSFDRLKTRSSAHMFNMFILPRQLLNDYCTWLFDILFTLEKTLENSPELKTYSPFHQRFYGRISELLLDVFLETNDIISDKNPTNSHYHVTELPVINIESVNWLKKGSSFLSAKFKGKKYEQSF